MKKLELNGFQIKLFMALLMVFDHVSTIPGFISPSLESAFHGITRVVGVWFAYTAVEGVMYTRNIKKYNIRLFTWAAIMFAGNIIINFLYSSSGIDVHNNIFLTLAIGVLMLTILKKAPKSLRNVKYVIVPIFIVVSALVTEGGMVIIPFMFITYITYGKNIYRNIGYVVFSALLFAMNFQMYPTWSETMNMLGFNSDFLFIMVLPFLYLYNGKRGSNSKFSKYFFYVFYPAHLWIIATIAYFVA